MVGDRDFVRDFVVFFHRTFETADTSPIPLPSSGSFLGPNTSKAIPIITNRLRISLRSDVLQVRSARRGRGATEGCRFYRSRYVQFASLRSTSAARLPTRLSELHPVLPYRY